MAHSIRNSLVLFLLLIHSTAWSYGEPYYSPDAAHPRIFLTTSVLTRLQDKMNTNDPDWLALKARADTIVSRKVAAYDRYSTPNGYIYYSYQGLPWLEAAQVLGIAYKITGTASYRNKLLELADVIIAAGDAPIIVDVGYPTRSVAVAAALIYDWCYDDLGATRKTNLISTINSWYNIFYNHTNGVYIPNDGNNNYLGGHILGFGLCGIATYGDNETAPAINTLVKSWWDGPVVTMFANEGKGGAILESYNYGPNHIARLLQYALAVKTASGKDIYSTYTDPLITNYFYNLKPNRWQSTDEGDFAGSFTGIMGKNLPLLLSSLDDSTQGDKIAFFTDNMATPYGGNSSAVSLQYVSSFDHVLFKNSRTRTDYRLTAPLHYRSLGDDHLFVRSDWTDSAVWASFAGSAAKKVGHQQKVAGHISIQRGGDYLLVNAGQWKGADGITGAPETMTQTNNNQNTFVTDGSATSLGANYIGGQGVWGLLNTVLKYETRDGISYMKTDLTSAYDKNNGTNLPDRDLLHWHRNFVHIDGGAFALYDRVKMKNTILHKEFRFHLHNQSKNTNNGEMLKSVLGSSALFIKSVYPPTAALTTATADNNIQSSVLKLTDTATSTEFNPLTILLAGENSMANPDIKEIDTGLMIGAAIENTSVILFSKDESSQSSVTYNIISSSTIKHTITDLLPGTYTVTQSGNTLGKYTVLNSGLLTFTTNGGGSFHVTQSNVTASCDASNLYSCTTKDACEIVNGKWCSGLCQTSACTPSIKSIKPSSIN